jgi:hypothetical protein
MGESRKNASFFIEKSCAIGKRISFITLILLGYCIALG